MDQQQTIAVTAAAFFAVLALLLALTSHRRISVMRKSLLMLQGKYDGKTLLDAVAAYVEHVDGLERNLGALGKRQEELFALLGRSARNLGVTRYDAFDDMGGRLSFSAALLDDHGDGVVITSINGRTESRAYAKVIEGGDSEHNLSPEERDAISEALGGRQKVRR